MSRFWFVRLGRIARSWYVAVLTAMLLAAVSAPLVAISISKLASFRPVQAGSGYVVAPITADQALPIALVAVLSAAIVASAIGYRYVRTEPVVAYLAVVAVAWPVAIMALPLLPGHPFAVGYYCIDGCPPPLIVGGQTGTGLAGYLMQIEGDLFGPGEVALVLLGIAGFLAFKDQRSAAASFALAAVIVANIYSITEAPGAYACLLTGALVWVAVFYPWFGAVRQAMQAEPLRPGTDPELLPQPPDQVVPSATFGASRRRYLAYVPAVVFLLVVTGAGSLIVPGNQPRSHDVVVTYRLINHSGSDIAMTQLTPSGCMVAGGDSSPNSIVELVSGNGLLLVDTRLPLGNGSTTACVFRFVLSSVPETASYTLTIGPGRDVSFDLQDMRDLGWALVVSSDDLSSGAGVPAPSATPADVSAPSVTPTHDVTGTYDLVGSGIVMTQHSAIACTGSGGYRDIGRDTPVTLRNGDGDFLGSTTLGNGIGSEDACAFHFRFWSVPEAASYTITVGQRRDVSFTRQDLQDRGWAFVVALDGGSSTPEDVSPNGSSKHDVTGTYYLIDMSAAGGIAFTSQTGSCKGTAYFRDMGATTQVTLRDGDGKLLASTALGPGMGISRTSCSFRFRLPAVPETTSYALTIGRRPAVVFTRHELETKGWDLTASLSN